MVTDDDVMVRKITAAVLRQQGFEVCEATDGEEALARWLQSPEAFDLVLLDMHMPRLGGLEVLERMRATSPAVKVVLLSGSVVGMPSDFLVTGVRYQQKPFQNDELIATVREALGLDQNRAP